MSCATIIVVNDSPVNQHLELTVKVEEVFMKKVLFVLTLLMILFWSNTSAHASEQHKEEDLCVARTENITVTRVFLNNDGKRVNTETYTITDPIEVSEFLSSVKWEEEIRLKM